MKLVQRHWKDLRLGVPLVAWSEMIGLLQMQPADWSAGSAASIPAPRLVDAVSILASFQ